jgi:hypothetical protein
MGFADPKLQRPGVRWPAALTGQKAEAYYWGWPSPWPSGLADPPTRRAVHAPKLVTERSAPAVAQHPTVREATGSSMADGESTGAVPGRRRVVAWPAETARWQYRGGAGHEEEGGDSPQQ